MLITRFKVRCKPDKTEAAMALFREIVSTSRPLGGTVHFDMGRDLTDPNSFIAFEVYKDRAALEQQEALPAVQKTMGLFEELAAAPPEVTVYEVSSSGP